MSEYDYIVVGAGSAGCLLAARLAERGNEVLLLEAGPTDRTRFCEVPGMVSVIHTVPQVKKRFDWGYYTVPQKNALDRRIPAVRGKVLGGSSSINGMLFVRGHRENYDDWAADGCPGWSYQDVLPAFKRMEDWEDGESASRGAGGPIAVTRQKGLTPASQAFIEAVKDTFNVPYCEDYNGHEQEGAMIFQQSARKGRRFSSSIATLRNNAARLTVRTGVLVERVVLKGSTATGVAVRVGAERQTVSARREVIVCAGVFGSPQILMLSGIGPAAHLRSHGIKAIVDLPVGDNLHDHMFVPMTFLAPSAVRRGTARYFLSGMIAEAVRGDSWFGRTVFEGGAFVRSKHARNVPDLQIHMLPWAYPSPNQDKPVRPEVDLRPAMTVMPTLIYPKSRGTVRLASSEPDAAPLIDPAYLTEQSDAQFLFDSVKAMRDMAASQHLKTVITTELHPADAARTDADLWRELPNRATTVYHPVGTCRMGSDERAVVDPLLRVRGIEGLRVADAAIMPSITGGNTNAPAMMIGERCAEIMVQRLQQAAE